MQFSRGGSVPCPPTNLENLPVGDDFSPHFYILLNHMKGIFLQQLASLILSCTTIQAGEARMMVVSLFNK
jgi:hypothetical protein